MPDLTPSIADWLRREGASEDIASWASAFGQDLDALWASCPRADWMLAIAGRLKVPTLLLREASRQVVTLAFDVLPDDDVSAEALETFEAKSDAELQKEADKIEERSDAAGDPAVAAALLAIASVLRATTSPEAAVMAAALTTQALVLDAGECAMMSVLTWSQRTSADRVRGVISAAVLPRPNA